MATGASEYFRVGIQYTIIMNNPLQVKPIKKISQTEKAVVNKLSQKKQNVLERFPLLFTLLGTFGLVAVLYGVEGIIDRIDVLSRNPVVLLITGVLILIFTGTLYKKLD